MSEHTPQQRAYIAQYLLDKIEQGTIVATVMPFAGGIPTIHDFHQGNGFTTEHCGFGFFDAVHNDTRAVVQFCGGGALQRVRDEDGNEIFGWSALTVKGDASCLTGLWSVNVAKASLQRIIDEGDPIDDDPEPEPEIALPEGTEWVINPSEPVNITHMGDNGTEPEPETVREAEEFIANLPDPDQSDTPILLDPMSEIVARIDRIATTLAEVIALVRTLATQS